MYKQIFIQLFLLSSQYNFQQGLEGVSLRIPKIAIEEVCADPFLCSIDGSYEGLQFDLYFQLVEINQNNTQQVNCDKPTLRECALYIDLANSYDIIPQPYPLHSIDYDGFFTGNITISNTIFTRNQGFAQTPEQYTNVDFFTQFSRDVWIFIIILQLGMSIVYAFIISNTKKKNRTILGRDQFSFDICTQIVKKIELQLSVMIEVLFNNSFKPKQDNISLKILEFLMIILKIILFYEQFQQLTLNLRSQQGQTQNKFLKTNSWQDQTTGNIDKTICIPNEIEDYFLLYQPNISIETQEIGNLTSDNCNSLDKIVPLEHSFKSRLGQVWGCNLIVEDEPIILIDQVQLISSKMASKLFYSIEMTQFWIPELLNNVEFLYCDNFHASIMNPDQDLTQLNFTDLQQFFLSLLSVTILIFLSNVIQFCQVSCCMKNDEQVLSSQTLNNMKMEGMASKYSGDNDVIFQDQDGKENTELINKLNSIQIKFNSQLEEDDLKELKNGLKSDEKEGSGIHQPFKYQYQTSGEKLRVQSPKPIEYIQENNVNDIAIIEDKVIIEDHQQTDTSNLKPISNHDSLQENYNQNLTDKMDSREFTQNQRREIDFNDIINLNNNLDTPKTDNKNNNKDEKFISDKTNLQTINNTDEKDLLDQSKNGKKHISFNDINESETKSPNKNSKLNVKKETPSSLKKKKAKTWTVKPATNSGKKSKTNITDSEQEDIKDEVKSKVKKGIAKSRVKAQVTSKIKAKTSKIASSVKKKLKGKK